MIRGLSSIHYNIKYFDYLLHYFHYDYYIGYMGIHIIIFDTV